MKNLRPFRNLADLFEDRWNTWTEEMEENQHWEYVGATLNEKLMSGEPGNVFDELYNATQDALYEEVCRD